MSAQAGLLQPVRRTLAAGRAGGCARLHAGVSVAGESGKNRPARTAPIVEPASARRPHAIVIVPGRERRIFSRLFS